MNPAVKELWLTALRSGKYKQGHGKLKVKRGDNIMHCCLGVLCEIAVAVGKATEFQQNASCSMPDCNECVPSIDFGYSEGTSARVYGMPPQEVREWAGLSDNHEGKAVSMNDTDKRDFLYIANVIESEF